MGFGNSGVARKGIVYVGTLLFVFLFLSFIGLSFKQSVASVMVLALVLGTVLFWEMRLAFALIGVSLLFGTGLLTIEKFVEFSSLNIIMFLAGMMLFVGFLEKNAFFEYLISRLLQLVGGGKRVYVILMVLSALFAALVDEVTSILFMLSIVLFLTSKLKVNPIPFVLMIVFATNIGSSATAVGNPVGVIIALNAKLSFSDFLSNAFPISFVCLLVCILVMYLYFRKEINEFAEKTRRNPLQGMIKTHETKQRLLSGVLFALVLLSLIFHYQTEKALGLEKNSLLIGTALAAAGFVVVLEGRNARHFVESKVDWWTLFFFMLLFSSVGALEESGVIQLAAQGFAQAIGENKLFSMLGITLISGFLSALLDNVLAVAVFVPLVKDLQFTLVAGEYLWWSLLFGATLFGNLTLIGSTANIVALGTIEKRKFGRITFFQWLKPGALVVASTVSVALILLYFQHLAGGL